MFYSIKWLKIAATDQQVTINQIPPLVPDCLYSVLGWPFSSSGWLNRWCPLLSLGGMTVQGAQDHMGLSGSCQPKCMGYERWMKRGKDRDRSLHVNPSAGY